MNDGLNKVADGEHLDYDIESIPERCTHTSSLSGLTVRCDRTEGHEPPHRVTVDWRLAGGVL